MKQRFRVKRQRPGRYLGFLIIRQGEIVIAEDQDERVLGFSHTISDTILKQGMDEQSKSLCSSSERSTLICLSIC